MLMSDASKFGKFARLLGALLSSGTGVQFGNKIARRGVRRPTGAALRNPADPFQAERIQKAAEKRERKAVTLVYNTLASFTANLAHHGSAETRMNPFHFYR